MAAGKSLRFGRNKLLEEFDGISMAGRALEAVPADRLYRVVVVTGFQEVQEMARTRNFEVVWNDCPEDGVSLTIRLGLERLQDADAALFMVCDQPLIMRSSISAMLEYYLDHPDRIVSMAYGGQRGNPCIFPSFSVPDLSALSGDVGGSAVIREHEASLLLFEAGNASELKDVDCESDLSNFI